MTMLAIAFSLMTYNVNYANPDPKSAIEAIEKSGADVVLLQEITTEWKTALEKKLVKAYPHQVFQLHTRAAGGFAVLSKVKIKSEEIVASPVKGWFPGERLVLETSFGDVQVLHVHLRPAVDGGSWLKGFITTRPFRLKEIQTYWKKIDTSLPTIVAGDFNEDPSGHAVEFLENKGLTRVPTTGPTTWHLQALEVDIDHVMVDGKLSAKDGTVLDKGKSDHRPVVVTIEPKPNK